MSDSHKNYNNGRSNPQSHIYVRGITDHLTESSATAILGKFGVVRSIRYYYNTNSPVTAVISLDTSTGTDDLSLLFSAQAAALVPALVGDPTTFEVSQARNKRVIVERLVVIIENLPYCRIPDLASWLTTVTKGVASSAVFRYLHVNKLTGYSDAAVTLNTDAEVAAVRALNGMTIHPSTVPAAKFNEFPAPPQSLRAEFPAAAGAWKGTWPKVPSTLAVVAPQAPHMDFIRYKSSMPKTEGLEKSDHVFHGHVMAVSRIAAARLYNRMQNQAQSQKTAAAAAPAAAPATAPAPAPAPAAPAPAAAPAPVKDDRTILCVHIDGKDHYLLINRENVPDFQEKLGSQPTIEKFNELAAKMSENMAAPAPAAPAHAAAAPAPGTGAGTGMRYAQRMRAPPRQQVDLSSLIPPNSQISAKLQADLLRPTASAAARPHPPSLAKALAPIITNAMMEYRPTDAAPLPYTQRTGPLQPFYEEFIYKHFSARAGAGEPSIKIIDTLLVTNSTLKRRYTDRLAKAAEDAATSPTRPLNFSTHDDAIQPIRMDSSEVCPALNVTLNDSVNEAVLFNAVNVTNFSDFSPLDLLTVILHQGYIGMLDYVRLCETAGCADYYGSRIYHHDCPTTPAAQALYSSLRARSTPGREVLCFVMFKTIVGRPEDGATVQLARDGTKIVTVPVRNIMPFLVCFYERINNNQTQGQMQ